jgi:cation diffusion facilitator family transporter
MSQHHPGSAAGADRRPLALVLGVGVGVLVIEVVGGLAANSLSLLADAGHVMTDITGIALALGAIRLADRPTTGTRTFGWYRAEVLAAGANALLLIGLAAFLLYESWQRLSHPTEVAGGLMLAVACLGAGGNLVSLWLLRAPGRRSLTLRGAYLEVLGDLLASVGVIVAALIVAVTGWDAADAVASALIGLLILPRAWSLLRETGEVLLEAVPRGLRMDEVRRHLLEAEGVGDVHDLHAWTITSGQPVVSAHVVLARDADPARVLDEVCRCLSTDFDIEHSTIQLETADRRRLEEATHP